MGYGTATPAAAASRWAARIVLAVAVVASLALALVAPARRAAASAPTRSGTWIGQVERDGDHFDYVGRACPIEEQICIDILARYPIVPTTPQAAEALPHVAGGKAKLLGSLVSVDGTQKLLVHYVAKA